MKHILTAVLFLCLFTSSYSQTVISEIDLAGGNVDAIPHFLYRTAYFFAFHIGMSKKATGSTRTVEKGK